MCQFAEQARRSLKLRNPTVAETLQLNGWVRGFERCRQDKRILDCHACILAKVRSHRVGCISNEQPGSLSPNGLCQLFQIMVEEWGFGERLED